MSNAKNHPKAVNEELQAALQNLITQGRKEGMIRAADLNAQLEKMDLTPEKIEAIYDSIDAMNIQIVTADLELDLGDSLDLDDGLDGDLDLSELGLFDDEEDDSLELEEEEDF